jgi:predicted butyrate kinase (DUF1464 family)
VAALRVAVPDATEVIVSGRLAHRDSIRDQFAALLRPVMKGTIEVLTGFAATAKQASQGAALIADGLAGGRSAPLVEAMGLRRASGTVLDHLFVISPATARERLGLRG